MRLLQVGVFYENATNVHYINLKTLRWCSSKIQTDSDVSQQTKRKGSYWLSECKREDDFRSKPILKAKLQFVDRLC